MVYWRGKTSIICPSFPPSICLSVCCSVSLGLAVWHFSPSLSILLCRRACKHTRACACVRACVSACMNESVYARVLMHACVSKWETSVLLSDTHWTVGKNSVCKQMYAPTQSVVNKSLAFRNTWYNTSILVVISVFIYTHLITSLCYLSPWLKESQYLNRLMHFSIKICIFIFYVFCIQLHIQF